MEYYSAIKKERNWVICRHVDGPRDCHTEWSTSEREKQISYINAYMWNLEKCYRWTSLQGRNRHRCRKQTYGHKKGKAGMGGDGCGMNWEIGIDIYTLICIKSVTKGTCCIQSN